MIRIKSSCCLVLSLKIFREKGGVFKAVVGSGWWVLLVSGFPTMVNDDDVGDQWWLLGFDGNDRIDRKSVV